MDIKNKLYSNQGIHLITSIFTIENGVVKVLLIKRKKEPYKDTWALVGGALYNNEELLIGANREIYEKTGIKNISIYEFKTFSRVDRSPIMRMIAVGYIGVIDLERVRVLKETEKTIAADWFPIDKIPKLGYDYEEILIEAIKAFKIKIIDSDILKELFPNDFTLPELHKVYETILERKIDRRNFRKKLLMSNLIIDTKKEKRFEGKKPAKLYRFNSKSSLSKNVF